MNTSAEASKALARILQSESNPKKLQKLIEEVFTDAEIQKAYERIKIMQCLYEGDSQRITANKTGAAIATVSRGAQLAKQEKTQLEALIAKHKTTGWWRSLFWSKQ